MSVSWLCSWHFRLLSPTPNDIRTHLSAPVPTLGDGPLSGNMRLPINHSRMSVLPASSITLVSCLLVFKSC